MSTEKWQIEVVYRGNDESFMSPGWWVGAAKGDEKLAPPYWGNMADKEKAIELMKEKIKRIEKDRYFEIYEYDPETDQVELKEQGYMPPPPEPEEPKERKSLFTWRKHVT